MGALNRWLSLAGTSKFSSHSRRGYWLFDVRGRLIALRENLSNRSDTGSGILGIETLETRDLLAIDGLSTYLPPQYNAFQYDGFLTPPSTEPPLSIAENYLRSHAGDLGILPSDLDGFLVTTNYETASTGITTLTFQQSLHGLPVTNANFNITVMPDGELLAVAGGFVSGLSERTGKIRTTPGISSQKAVIAAANALDLPTSSLPQSTVLFADGSVTLSNHAISADDITTRLRYVVVSDRDVSLAWNLTVRTPDGDHWNSISVDCSTGAVIERVDYENHESYQVYPRPASDPNDAPRSVQNNPYLIAPAPAIVPSPFGWHDTNGAAGPESTLTQGNNVKAYADRNDDELPDGGSQPDGGPSLNFTGGLVPVDLSQPPSTYTQAAVTNLFYWNNILHDIHYLYGFDEASRNFQVNTYGRGGVGDDAVNAEAQDGADVNNADFSTPPDGFAPRMQMYEFDATSPRRDGDFDAEIIIHEYGHGVSNRLTGNGSGLSALQSRGMGEGQGNRMLILGKACD